MGSNHYGCLGLADNFLESISEPRLVESLINEKIISVSCGANHTVAINDKNEVYSWGLGEMGALGTGDTITYYKPTLLRYFSTSRIPTILASCGTKHTAFLSCIIIY